MNNPNDPGTCVPHMGMQRTHALPCLLCLARLVPARRPPGLPCRAWPVPRRQRRRPGRMPSQRALNQTSSCTLP